MLREIPEAEVPCTPISLIADILVNIGMVIGKPGDMMRIASHIALLADSLKAGGDEVFSGFIADIASSLGDGSLENLRVSLAKLVFYTLNTFY